MTRTKEPAPGASVGMAESMRANTNARSTNVRESFIANVVNMK